MSRWTLAGTYRRLGDPAGRRPEEHTMGKVIVIEFVTLDGVVEDPDGNEGTPGGGWMWRFGPETVAGDKFKLGPMMDTGVLLLGRKTWEMFSHIWPNQSDEFSDAMNRMAKVVVSRSAPDLNAWSNSSLLEGELVAGVGRLTLERDVVVAGSTSVVHALAAADAVDEYHLLVFPTALGTGRKLFVAPVDLQLTSLEQSSAAVLARYERPATNATPPA
jgi:dihydrofolate reductase